MNSSVASAKDSGTRLSFIVLPGAKAIEVAGNLFIGPIFGKTGTATTQDLIYV
jgi:hypothetical protein